MIIKAVIFDLNGIFLKSPNLSDRFAKDFNIPVATFLPKLSEIMSNVRLPGANPAFSYWEPVLKKWGVHFSEQEFLDYCFKDELPSSSMVDIAKELKAKGIKTFILSNNFKERTDYHSNYPWRTPEVIDKVYFSWETGIVKPNPEAWKLILKENKLIAEECIYFDDHERNIDVAKDMGMHAFLCVDEGDIRKEINKLVPQL